MNKPILEVQNLRKEYKEFVLKDVSFSLPAGYIMGFVGPNGSGKTTTIKSILGLIHPSGGKVKLFGQEMQNPQEDIGIVLDQTFYLDSWTVKQVGKAVAPFYSRWDKAKFASLIEKFKLSPSLKVNELSRGMKMKLMMAVALSHGAKLLVLDEPSSGLDPVAREEMTDLLAEFVLDESHSVLFSTHITSDLENIADFVTYIRQGRIVYSGGKDELMEKFVVVKGGLEELDESLEGQLIGLRKHANGFEGLLNLGQMGKLAQGLVTEKPTLDEIVVFMNNGGEVQ